MISWILDNLATILISSLLIVIVISIIKYLIRQKRDGKNSCGCDCGHCSMHGSCHGGWALGSKGVIASDCPCPGR